MRSFSIKSCVVALCGFAALATGSARADTATFGPKHFDLPKKVKVSATVGSVTVTKAGKITVKITNWHCKGILGIFGNVDPKIRVRAELIHNGKVVKHTGGKKGDIILSDSRISRTLEYQATEADLKASQKFSVRVKSTDPTNAMDFE